MKTTFKILIVIFTVFLFSCEKEKISGCSDPDSTNFNSLALVDDGSCNYQSSVNFWVDKTGATFLTNDGAISLTFYLDGIIIGSQSANLYLTSEPVCGGNGINQSLNLGVFKSKQYQFSVKDQTGWEYWEGTITLKANECLVYKLTE